MPKMKLTALTVSRLPVPESGQVDYFDTVLPAFGVRISLAGTRSYFVMVRIHEKLARLTIGKAKVSDDAPGLSLKEAREKAGEWAELAARGIDPRQQKAEAEKEEARRRADTVDEVAALFIERYAKLKNRSWKDIDRILRTYMVSAWTGRPITDIKRRDVVAMLDSIVDRGTPTMANRVLAHVRKMFNWCIERGIIESSPMVGIKAPGREVSRDRVLSDHELKAVWIASETLEPPFSAFVRLLILTAQRRDEVANMTWDEIDLEKRMWTIPKERAKNGLAHEVPLSRMAFEILDNLPRFGPFVLTSTGKTPISGFSKAKTNVDRLSEVTSWTYHDLRRTATTGMAQLGVPPHIADKILNHKTGSIRGVAAVYNRYGYIEERNRALEMWGNHVENIATGKMLNNVVNLRR
jgi:integrase